jgi:hypothetical protein
LWTKKWFAPYSATNPSWYRKIATVTVRKKGLKSSLGANRGIVVVSC